MNIGIDMDYTITEMPEFFSVIAQAMRKAGHKVYVVSYRYIDDMENIQSELSDLGIEHDGIFLHDTNERIGEFKARIATELDLDVFIDDMPEALVDMPPKVKRLWLCNPSVYDLKAVIVKMLEAMRF